MTERNNESRARSAWHCLTQHARAGDEDIELGMSTEGVKEMLIDALADFRHLCDAVGLEYHKADKMAHMHYREEKEREL